MYTKRTVCVEFATDLVITVRFFLFEWFLWMQAAAGSSWPLWRHVSGKLYCCSKNCPFYCSVLKFISFQLWVTCLTSLCHNLGEKNVYFMKPFISKLKIRLKYWLPLLKRRVCVHYKFILNMLPLEVKCLNFIEFIFFNRFMTSYRKKCAIVS